MKLASRPLEKGNGRHPAGSGQKLGFACMGTARPLATVDSHEPDCLGVIFWERRTDRAARHASNRALVDLAITALGGLALIPAVAIWAQVCGSSNPPCCYPWGVACSVSKLKNGQPLVGTKAAANRNERSSSGSTWVPKSLTTTVMHSALTGGPNSGNSRAAYKWAGGCTGSNRGGSPTRLGSGHTLAR
jgi:hypothetical protein